MGKFLQENSDGFVLLRGCDSTPWYVLFGRYQSLLESSARYLVRKIVYRPDGTFREEWRTASFNEYKASFPRANTRAGVVEMCGFYLELVMAFSIGY